VTVYYPWHPRCGEHLRAHRRVQMRYGDTFFCELPGDTVVAIPAWMTDPAAANYALGPPEVSTEALIELCDLLKALNKQPGEISSPKR
jgi:hypothetical protein